MDLVEEMRVLHEGDLLPMTGIPLADLQKDSPYLLEEPTEIDPPVLPEDEQDLQLLPILLQVPIVLSTLVIAAIVIIRKNLILKRLT
jgi:hypothetical protein